MVFLRLGLGFVVGLTLPQLVQENVYYTIATNFLRPHLQFRDYMSRKPEERAISTVALDLYVKDVVVSFFRFFVMIGPVVYYTYFKPEDELLEIKKDEDNVPIMNKDKYAQLLVQMKKKQLNQQGDEINPKQKKISFQEYEKFIEELERENKFQQLERNNPNSLLYGPGTAEELMQAKKV